MLCSCAMADISPWDATERCSEAHSGMARKIHEGRWLSACKRFFLDIKCIKPNPNYSFYCYSLRSITQSSSQQTRQGTASTHSIVCVQRCVPWGYSQWIERNPRLLLLMMMLMSLTNLWPTPNQLSHNTSRPTIKTTRDGLLFSQHRHALHARLV